MVFPQVAKKGIVHRPCITLTYLICLFCEIAFGLVAHSPQTVFRRHADPPRVTSGLSAGLQASSHLLSLPTGPARSSNGTITAAPTTNPPNTLPSEHMCLIGASSCTGSKTWDGPSLSLSDQCVLWNSSCTGDKTSAAENFFDNVWMLDEKPCWRNPQHHSIDCAQYEPPETLSAMGKIKEWMRGPACLPLSLSINPVSTTISNPSTTIVTTTNDLAADGETCCGQALIIAANVDLYYWPDSNADTSCLSIVGDSVSPLYHGATMSGGSAYWGCSARKPKTSIGSSLLYNLQTQETWTTTTDIQSIITTAMITSVNSLTFKIPLVNPWSLGDCVGNTESKYASTHEEATQQPIQARGHSLVITAPLGQSSGVPISTVVSGTLTFTSPSIYANFHSVYANDWCGELGSQVTIAQTMLSFSPGELSTIAGPLQDHLTTPHSLFSTKVFDFADLPCPPQSVMEENWYKPAPGEPYRPLLALPKKLKDVDPAYSAVQDFFFTAYDPPKTLVLAGAMVPDVTTSHVVAASAKPTPGSSPSMGASKTTQVDEPLQTPIQSQALSPSLQTTTSEFVVEPPLVTQQHMADPAPTSLGENNSAVLDPDSGGYLSSILEALQATSQNWDPDPGRASSDQMSSAASALALALRPQSLQRIPHSTESSSLQNVPMRGSQVLPGGLPVIGQTVAPEDIPPAGNRAPQESLASVIGTSMIVNAPSLPTEVPQANEHMGSALVPNVAPFRTSVAAELTAYLVSWSGSREGEATVVDGNDVQSFSTGMPSIKESPTAASAPTTKMVAAGVDSSSSMMTIVTLDDGVSNQGAASRSIISDSATRPLNRATATTNGVRIASSSGYDPVIGSESMDSATSRGNLGSAIATALPTRTPSADNPQESSAPAPDSSSRGGQTLHHNAGGIQIGVPRAMVAVIVICMTAYLLPLH